MKTIFNWKLYHTFTQACEQRDFDIRYTHGTCQVGRQEWPAYVILWTPMNKMPIFERETKRLRMGDNDYWKFELESLENEIDDFHVEIASHDLDNMMKASCVGWWKLCHPLEENPTIEGWLDVIDFCQDQDRINKEYFMYKLQQDPEDELA